MCGIVGVLNTDGKPVSIVTLRAMTDAVAHRGPDGEGCYTDSVIGLGHRRLAIIDLSPAGHQPMVTADGDMVLTYNGEVYNFQELRTELEAKGHWFHSKTDSEVVLNAYKEWGPGCVDRFDGMFAFAVWDKRNQQLFLARDRYGIKPLYYTQLGTTFLFASEIKAMRRHPAFRDVALDPAAVHPGSGEKEVVLGGHARVLRLREANAMIPVIYRPVIYRMGYGPRHPCARRNSRLGTPALTPRLRCVA